MGPDGGVTDSHRKPAILWSACVALLLAAAFAIGRANGDEARPLSIQAWVLLGLAGALPACLAYRRWAHELRFGTSRLLLQGPPPPPGGMLTATLAAAERLAQAREVRFELVEIDRSSYVGGPHCTQVRATGVVTLPAFRVLPGSTRVPVALTVPADGSPSEVRTSFGFSVSATFLFGPRKTVHSWQLRATADAGGASYQASFQVPVGSLVPEEPYTPRPIVIPPSDKRPRRA